MATRPYFNVDYGFSQALNNVLSLPIVAKRAPTVNDTGFQIGQIWVYVANNAPYILTSVLGGSATWLLLESGGGAGVFASLTVTPGPTSITGTTGINTSGAGVTSIGTGGTGAVNIGNTTGNTSVTGTLTTSAGITATTGNISASAGKLASVVTGTANALTADSSGGTGVTAILTSSGATVDALQLAGGGLKVAPLSSASGASPRVVNARFGVGDFTDIIATTTTVALTITNSLITSSSIMLFGLSCSTVGSALVVRNYVPGAGTVTVNITNLGASDTAADIFVAFWLLN